MSYDTEVVDENHEAEWLENFGDRGALMFVCEDGDGSVILSAGWAHVEVCPVCGEDVTVNTTEL